MTAPLGRPRVHHRLTDSTNERAKALAAAGAPHGTLVTAAEQSAGRGRQGRSWVAPPGRAVLMSLLLRDLGEHDAALPLAAAVAVCEACEAAAPVRCAIKWPNDIWIERRKVAGILVEGRPQDGWAVLGIGLNVALRPEDFPDELRGRATGMGLEPDDVDRVLAELLRHLEARLAQPVAAMLGDWRARDVLHGREINWNGGSGTAEGVDDAGRLLVRTPTGEIAELDAGEVHIGAPPASES